MAQVYPQPTWRIKLDVPHQFALEAGHISSPHCHDIRLQSEVVGTQNVWQDPNTGLVMLRPSWLSANAWEGGLHVLSSWIHATSWWKPHRRGQAAGSSPGFMSLLAPPSVPSGESHNGTLYDISGFGGFYNPLVDLAILVIAAALPDDTLVWALQSNESLADDEGFVIHYNLQTDQQRRFHNWFGVAWGHLYVRFGLDGICTVYAWTNRDRTGSMVQIDQFEIASPGEIGGKDGYFIFQSIPGYGLNIYHSRTPQRVDARHSSAKSGTTRGHLVLMDPETDDDGYLRNIRSSPVSIAVNPSPFAAHSFGFQTITYPAEGTFVSAQGDPGYYPTETATYALATRVNTRYGAFTNTLRNADNSGDWTPGANRKYRLKVVLSTSNTKYTPYLLGYTIRWLPVFAKRDTTPVIPEDFSRLEWSVDDTGNIEGVAVCRMESAAARAIVERGDTTWVIERCDDPGAETPAWTVESGGMAGGLAKLTGAELCWDPGGMLGCYYIATWTLRDKKQRLQETTQLMDHAFDGMNLKAAVEDIFHAAGEPAPTYATGVAAALEAITLPELPKGQSWRFGTTRGDHGDDLLRGLLLFARKQFIEYRAWYNWGAATSGNNWTGEWVIDRKPRDTSSGQTWTLTPFLDELSGPAGADGNTGSARTVLIGIPGSGSTPPKIFDLFVDPPEFNVLQLFGVTKVDPDANRIPGKPWYNDASRTDTTSTDYLGRKKVAQVLLATVTDPTEIARMTRRVADAAGHRRARARTQGSDYFKNFTPGKRVKLRGIKADGTRGYLLGSDVNPDTDPTKGMWLRRRTVCIAPGEGGLVAPQISYHLDTLWEGPLSDF